MTQRLRVAIVGAGLVAARHHLPAVLACADAELSALVDTTAERARALATRLGLAATRVATAVDDVLDTVDAAVIATPNASHDDLAAHCLRAGVHVPVGKPLATSANGGEAIVRAAVDFGSDRRRGVRQALPQLGPVDEDPARRWVFRRTPSLRLSVRNARRVGPALRI